MKKGLLPFLLFSAFCIYSCQKDPVIKFPPDVVTDGHVTDTIASSEDTIKLTGTATDKDGEVVAYLWSLVTGPNVPEIITPGLPQTYISAEIPGTYIFQLMATDNEGYTGVAFDTVIVVEKHHVETTIIIKNDSTVINEMLIAGYSTTNLSDGGSPEIDAYDWTEYGLPDLGKGAFKFNLSQIPANATIKSAKLTLYSNPSPQNGNQIDANYGSYNAMFIERITSDWNTATTTWQNQPSTDTQDHVSIPQSNQSREDLIGVDVTSLVQNMITGTNYGFEIRLQQNVVYNSRLFCGSRFSDVSKHPFLEVTY